MFGPLGISTCPLCNQVVINDDYISIEYKCCDINYEEVAYVLLFDNPTTNHLYRMLYTFIL